MAKKRMFNYEVLDTDAFLDMPLSAQALYFHLSMRADDDGFIGKPKRVTEYVHASMDDLKLLIAKRFVLTFDDGVMVIKHWKMHNTIQKDRYTPTNYQEDLALLKLKPNKAYTHIEDELKALENNYVSILDTECIQNVSTDIDIDKDIDKDIDINISCANNDDIYAFFESVWKLYPRKKGKSSIKPARLKELYKIGYDRLSKAVLKYADEVKGREEQYILMGSTFFNGRYVDYLDDEVTDSEVVADDLSEYQ